jgi:hypothetical protein
MASDAIAFNKPEMSVKGKKSQVNSEEGHAPKKGGLATGTSQNLSQTGSGKKDKADEVPAGGWQAKDEENKQAKRADPSDPGPTGI